METTERLRPWIRRGTISGATRTRFETFGQEHRRGDHHKHEFVVPCRTKQPLTLSKLDFECSYKKYWGSGRRRAQQKNDVMEDDAS